MPQAFSPTATATSSEAPRTPQQQQRGRTTAVSPPPALRTPRSTSAGLGFTEESVDRRRSGTPLHAPVQRRAREKIEVRSEVEKAEETAREAARLRRIGKEKRRALRAPTTPPPPACRARETLASPVLFSPQQAGSRQQLRAGAVCPPPSALCQPVAGSEAGAGAGAVAAAAAAPSKLEAMRAKRKWGKITGGEASAAAGDGASAEEVPAKRRALSLQARRTEAKEKALAAAAAAAAAAEDATRSPLDVNAAHHASLGFRSAGQQQCGGRPAVAQGTLLSTFQDLVQMTQRRFPGEATSPHAAVEQASH